MEKVILITSREIGKTKGNAKISEINPYEKLSTSFDLAGAPKIDATNYLGLLFCDEWQGKISKLDAAQRVSNSTYVDNYLNDSTGLASYAKEHITDMIEKVKNNPFIFGILYYCGEYNQEKYHVYFAEEFPFGGNGFTEDKQRYLNAIVGEIESHLKANHVDKNQTSWNIYSHEKDWGKEDETKELTKSEITIMEEFSKLKEIFEDETTVVRVFTHTHGLFHKYVQKLFTGDFVSFENFQNGCKEQLSKSKKLVTKEHLEEEDIREFIQNYNPEYPIFETPYNTN